MPSDSPQLANPEHRNIGQDLETLERRLEHFRGLYPRDKSREIGDAAHIAFDRPQGLPEIAASDLSAAVLRYAIKNHGALIVRGMLPQQKLRQELRDIIDKVIDSTHPDVLKSRNYQRGIYYNPPTDIGSFTSPRNMAVIRKFLSDVGGAMCMESPGVAEVLLDLYDSMGLKQILTEYLEEAPCVSVKKWVLRRTKLPISEDGWHQDGAFMGTDIKSLNMWLTLTHCGAQTEAPGLDIVPGRTQEIINAEGAAFEWSSGPEAVEAALGGKAYISPEFNSGDALFFDHFNLHRSQFRDHFSKPRHAIETWFFGSESFPKGQIPIAW